MSLKKVVPTFPAVFGRSYTRTENGVTETLAEVWTRISSGLGRTHQKDGTKSMYGLKGYKDLFMDLKVFPSGRWLWVGGTDWVYQYDNVYGAYNCMSRHIEDFILDVPIFGELAMCGTGTGASIRDLPPMGKIERRINLTLKSSFGTAPKRKHYSEMRIDHEHNRVFIKVGDSRAGWNDAYRYILQLATNELDLYPLGPELDVTVSFENVRPKGEILKGFGGVANPERLPKSFENVVYHLNNYYDSNKEIDPYLITICIDEFAEAVVAGNIRRSAGIREYDYDKHPHSFKSGLYTQNENGDWVVDPRKQCLRMSNHTVAKAQGMFTLEELSDLMQRNISSGEDAPKCDRNEILRANRDLFTSDSLYLTWDEQRVALFEGAWDKGSSYVRDLFRRLSPYESDAQIDHRMNRVGFNPCGEILGKDFLCNLSEVHANQLDPMNMREINRAFEAAALFAAPLLKDEFPDERFQFSREEDPIVGISITGLFDFFYHLFGKDWLYWWKAGRPSDWKTFEESVDHAVMVENLADLLRNTYDDGYDINDVYDQVLSDYPEYDWLYSTASFYTFVEKLYLRLFRLIATIKVHEYCEREGLRKPNRCTTIQPSGSKSLLTGASPGWHPPKYKRYVRRITFSVGHPLCKVLMDMGYRVIPGQSSVDENGVLLPEDRIYDERCKEWLLEIPCQVEWADEDVNPFDFSAAAQFDFYQQVQKEYTTHNCFSRDTAFYTSKGLKTFENFNPGETVTVLNKDGNWVDAKVVRTDNLRQLYAIKLRQGKTGREKTIKATSCHRFPTRRKSPGASTIKIRTTEELKPGMRLVTNPLRPTEGLRAPLAILHGLTISDGSHHKNNGQTQLYLCGKKRKLTKYLILNDYRVIDRDDIDQTRIYGLPNYLKDRPNLDGCGYQYLAGLFAGLLAGDGNVHKSTITYSTKFSEDADWFVDLCYRLGIQVTSVSPYKSGVNAYNPEQEYYEVTMSKETVDQTLILRDLHVANYTQHKPQPLQWRVVSVEEIETDYGWCVMEPETNHFTLQDNILVMNTSATIELREEELQSVIESIHTGMKDGWFISAAFLPRYDAPFPRLPFEEISFEEYTQRISELDLDYDHLEDAMRYMASKGQTLQPEDAACSSGSCELRISKG